MDLEPDAACEARLVMTDPDGVSGPPAGATRVVTVHPAPAGADYRGLKAKLRTADSTSS
jgi:hypothetical protein